MNHIKSKSPCCECKNCIHICPTHAIELKYNSFGTSYPIVNEKICINCGKCVKSCVVVNDIEKHTPLLTYACLSKSEEEANSSSGGVFFELAKYVIKKKGVVIGVAFADNLSVEYIEVSTIEELYRIQGSKYVKGNVNTVFQRVKNRLMNDKFVLFSGTPCHVAALKLYLQELSNCRNLLTVDLICHGTPPYSLFSNYIKHLEKKTSKKVVDYKFRDKTYKYGITGKICFLEKKGISEKRYFKKENSYYSLFLKGYINCDYCYQCKFAETRRVGDITLGDFWGAGEEIPGFFIKNNINFGKDISAVIINTEDGANIFKSIKNKLLKKEIKLESVSKYNNSLNRPTPLNQAERSKIETIYKEKGYNGIEKYFKRMVGIKRFSHRIRLILRKL